MKRRDFIIGGSVVAGAGLWLWNEHGSSSRGDGQQASTENRQDPGCITTTQIRGRPPFPPRFSKTLEAVLGVLLPDEPMGVPLSAGAIGLGAFAYIAREITSPKMRTTHRLLMRGAVVVDRVAVSEEGKVFSALAHEAQVSTLEAVVNGAGGSAKFSGVDFVKTMVGLGLEGMFADPRHGGNKDGQGWKSIEYAMAMPRPSDCILPTAQEQKANR